MSAIPDRWNGKNLRAALERPRLIARELRTWLTSLTYPIYNRRWRERYGDGIDVVDEDWDNLLILDACRHDVLEDQRSAEGDLSPVVSAGSSSYEFVTENFVGRDLHDTVYVTANPYVEELSDTDFYTVENLLVDHWDDQLGTVPPDVVEEAAANAHERYPDKRLVVHFMQPHQPYLGSTARQIRDRVGIDTGFNKYQCVQGVDTHLSGTSWFGSVILGDISLDELRTVYAENVDMALDHAERLTDRLGGKSVITADHGELLGEQLGPMGHRVYGHRRDCYAPELRVVPWLEIQNGSRRTISADDPIGFDRLEEGDAEHRLRALGYVPD